MKVFSVRMKKVVSVCGIMFLMMYSIFNLLLSTSIHAQEGNGIKIYLHANISNNILEFVEGLEEYTMLGLKRIINYTEEEISHDPNVIWTSSNTDVATMKGNGILPLEEGKTVITAEHEGYTDSVEIQVVKAELTDLTFNLYNDDENDDEINLTLFINKTIPFDVSGKVKSAKGHEYFLSNLTLSNIEEVVWKAEDPGIVDIQDGISGKYIFAKAPGSTTITLKYKGLQASVNVNVTDPKVKNISISRERVVAPVSDTTRGFSLDLYAKLEDGSTKNISSLAEWSSSNMEIATVINGVSYAGNGSILKNGKAVITVKYEDFVGTVDVFGVKGKTIEITVDDPVMAIEEYLADSKDEKEIDPGRGTKPIIRNDRMLLPIRAVVEEFGGEITWDDSTREVSITMFDKNIVLTIDKYEAVVNGTVEEMDVAPIIHNDRTMLPLRFISERLGLKVDWEHETRIASITDYNWEDEL